MPTLQIRIAVLYCGLMALFGATYQVRIHYREPTYELYAGAKARPYHWTYHIAAGSAQEAKDRALEEFADMAKRSQVSWLREVILIELDGGASR